MPELSEPCRDALLALWRVGALGEKAAVNLRYPAVSSAATPQRVHVLSAFGMADAAGGRAWLTPEGWAEAERLVDEALRRPTFVE